MSQTQITTNSLKDSSVTSAKLSSSITIGTLGVTGNLTVDTNTLFVDSVNNRVGVGTITPAYTLDVSGNATVRGKIYAANSNSAATPSISFINDTDTGLYNDGANYIKFAVGGNYRLALGPQFILSNDTPFTWTNGTPAASQDISLSRGAAGKIYVGNGTIYDYTGTLIAGNVGIGTTFPSYKLDVNGTGNFAGNVTMLGTANVTGDFVVDTNTLYVDSLSNRVGIGTTSPSAQLSIASTSGEYINLNNQVGVYNNQIIGPTVATAGNTLLLVQSNGTMGTGGSLLKVVTSGGVGLRITETGSINYTGSGAINSSAGFSVNGYTITESYGLRLGGDTTHPVQISSSSLIVGPKIAGNDYGTNNLLVLGNVGIGTTTPSQKLTVSGNISASGLFTAYKETSTNYIVLSTDSTINCLATLTVTLPTAVGIVGRNLIIKNSGTGVATLNTTSSQLIDGQLTQSLNQWDSITVQSTGTSWIII